MVELADTLDLGSSGQPCRFKSCYPHHLERFSMFFVEKCFILTEMQKNERIFRKPENPFVFSVTSHNLKGDCCFYILYYAIPNALGSAMEILGIYVTNSRRMIITMIHGQIFLTKLS